MLKHLTRFCHSLICYTPHHSEYITKMTNARDLIAVPLFQQRTVKRWLNRFDKEGTVETRERCGRKRATTSEQDEAIIRLASQTPITAAKAVLPALGLTCSVDTVRERLHKAGIHNWSPSRKYMQRIPLGLVHLNKKKNEINGLKNFRASQSSSSLLGSLNF